MWDCPLLPNWKSKVSPFTFVGRGTRGSALWFGDKPHPSILLFLNTCHFCHCVALPVEQSPWCFAQCTKEPSVSSSEMAYSLSCGNAVSAINRYLILLCSGAFYFASGVCIIPPLFCGGAGTCTPAAAAEHQSMLMVSLLHRDLPIACI